MSARAAEAAAVTAVAALLTLMMAAPVLRAPSERIFGVEIVGRHYDPFTVMEQFNQSVRWTAFLQPVSDLPGALVARYVGPVAAYNALVLISFPLTALAAYLLARQCALAPLAAAGAALVVAFSPFHVAHAAYHPHVAQLQWLPLYLWALWRCLDWPTPAAVALLACAVVGVTLSNFYGGLIAIAITPVSIAVYWLVKMRRDRVPVRRLLVTSATLAAMAMAGAAYAWYVAADAFLGGDAALSFARGDVARYSATWSSYLLPQVAHPLLADTTRVAGPALLEQQLTLGWALLALSGVAVAAWFGRRHTAAVLSAVPMLVAIAVFALVCSLGPADGLSALLPMFRSYARFGSVVQLMVALLAAIGAEHLWQSRARGSRMLVIALAMVTVVEYAVWPSRAWRDVLPTAAHRWVAQQPDDTRALDCHPYSQESQSVQWLTDGRVTLRADSIGDCREPGVLATLSDAGFTHMLVRRHSPEGRWLRGRPAPDGLRLAAQFDDADVFEVTEAPSLIRTLQTHAFYPVEFNEAWSWRWMGPQAAWTVVNVSERSLLASVDLETNAFTHPRQLSVLLDGLEIQRVVIEPTRAIRRIGPMAIRPGEHTLIFRATAPPPVADDVMHNGDPRALSVAIGEWRWSLGGGAK